MLLTETTTELRKHITGHTLLLLLDNIVWVHGVQGMSCVKNQGEKTPCSRKEGSWLLKMNACRIIFRLSESLEMISGWRRGAPKFLTWILMKSHIKVLFNGFYRETELISLLPPLFPSPFSLLFISLLPTYLGVISLLPTRCHSPR